MKALRIFPTLICLCMALTAFSQDPDSSIIYYEYELISTGELVGNDTVYQVFLLIDSTQVNRFKKLIVLNENQEKVITIKSKDLGKDKDSALTTYDSNYRIDIDHWSKIENWMIIGEKEDKSKKYLDEKKKKKKHVVIDTPLPVDMSLRIDSTTINQYEPWN